LEFHRPVVYAKLAEVSKRFLTQWLLISLGLHLIAAVFSIGYQNSDEHFQILEFLNAALGGTPRAALAIEYSHQIRPWFQPFLYWLPVKLMMTVGFQNPIRWALSVRILSSLIGWLSVVSLASLIPYWIQEIRWQKLALIMLCLFWYLPALHARHSSENLSGSLFIIGLCLIFRKLKQPASDLRFRSFFSWIGFGVLWGFAFEARYQVGLMVAGGVFWLLLIARLRWTKIAYLFLGIFAAIGIGTYLDYLGYGQWTFAPWNYFHFNLIQDYVSSTDVSPWWDYFRRSWTESWPILGFLTLIGVTLFWIAEPLHFLTWTHLPFFIVHVLIGHKETRFLFPIFHSAPLAIAILLFNSHRHFSGIQAQWQKFRGSRTAHLLANGLIFLNGIALVSFSLAPAAPIIRFYDAVYQHSVHELWHPSDQNPYTLLGIPLYFYRPKELALFSIADKAPEQPFWFASPAAKLSDSLPTDMRERCHAKAHSLPDWNLFSRFRNWTLYKCRARSGALLGNPVPVQKTISAPDLKTR
jgi:phosphatidylinositol glycan class B